MSRLERLLVLLLVVAAASGGFSLYVDASGPAYMRQRNPVALQTLQLPPAVITDAGTDAVANTATLLNYDQAPWEYPGRIAFNAGTQSVMVYRDAGAASGWYDLAFAGGEDDLDWSFVDAGNYLVPAAHPDGGVAEADVRVGIGRAAIPESGFWLHVGDGDDDRGHVLLESEDTAAASASLELEFGPSGGQHGRFDITGTSGAGTGSVRLQIDKDWNLVFGNAGATAWYIAGPGYTYPDLLPGTAQVQAVGALALPLHYVYTQNISSGSLFTELSFGTSSSLWWKINNSGELVPLPDNARNLGNNTRRPLGIYTYGINLVGNTFGTSSQVLHGGATATWSAIDLATTVTGCLGETNGGTANCTYTQGDLLYASASNTLSKLPAGTAGQILQTGGVAGAPSWINRPTHAVHTTIMLTATGSNSVAENVGVTREASAHQSIVVALNKTITAGTLTVNVKSGAPADPLVTTTRHTIALTSASGYVAEDTTGTGAIADNDILEIDLSTDGSFDWTNSGTVALQVEVQAFVED